MKVRISPASLKEDENMNGAENTEGHCETERKREGGGCSCLVGGK